MPGTNLSFEGNQSENSNSSSSRDSTPEDALVAGFSEQLSLKRRPTFSEPKASSCCIGRGRQRRPSRPAPRPSGDLYYEPCCTCRNRTGYQRCEPGAPAPVSRTRETRRKDGKVVLPCPGCEEPRVPPLPNECFTFCKTHVNDFNNTCRVYQTSKMCAQKCVKKCMKKCMKK